MEPVGKPLRGIRVLELARTLAGPWMGQILADLGADVVKVERRGIGDETRCWGPPFVAAGAETPHSAYFQACNRGKRSVEADFSTDAGCALVRGLARAADIVIENFKVGTLARYGLDAPTLCKANPRLIWCSITGFGHTGPYAARPGYDFIIQAMSGLLMLNGQDLAQPRRVPIPTSDLFTGVYGAVAVLSALHQRQTTGRGTIVDLSLFDVQMSTLSHHLLGPEPDSRPPEAVEPVVPQIVVPTADGLAALVIASDLQFRRLLDGLRLGEFADDPRFRDNAARRTHLDALVAILSASTQSLGTADFVRRMEELGVPAAPVNTLMAAARDAHFQARGIMVPMPGPPGGPARAMTVRTPILFDGLAMAPERGAPKLGEHNADVASDPGWTAQPNSDQGNRSR